MQLKDERIAGNLAEAHRQWADELFASKKDRFARTHYLHAAEVAPSEGRYHLAAAMIPYKRERYADASKELAGVLRKFPKLQDAYLILGDCELRLVGPVKAVATWRRGLAIDNEHMGLRGAIEKHARDAEAEKDLYADQSTHFVFHYDLYARDVAKHAPTLARDLEDAFTFCQKFFLFHLPAERLRIVLYNEKDFRKVTQTDKFVGGLFDGRIRIPVNHYQKERRRLIPVMRHEMIHAFVYDMCRKAPVWLNEGWAQIAEGRNVGQVRARLKRTGLLPAKDLWGSFLKLGDETKIRRAYDTALALTTQLERDYSRYALVEFIKALQKNPDEDPAKIFETRFYLKLEDALAQLERELKR